jgi:DnaJ-class molecular chaperone
MKEEFMRMQETPYMDKCSECDGEGTVLEEVPMPHNFNRDIGFIDTKTVTCETCSGAQEVERLCNECSEWVTINVPESSIICDNCIDIRDNGMEVV